MNDMSLKAKIRNIASKKNISASAVLQNYLNNRFLFRLAKSEYLILTSFDSKKRSSGV